MAPDDKGPDKNTNSATVVAFAGKQQPQKGPTVQQLITQSTEQALARDSAAHSGNNFPAMPTPQQTNGDRPETVANDDYGFPASWLGFNQNTPPAPLAAANDTKSTQPTAQTEREEQHVVGLLDDVRNKHNAGEVTIRQRQVLTEQEEQELEQEEDEEKKGKPQAASEDNDGDDDAGSNASKMAELLAATAAAGAAAAAKAARSRSMPRLPGKGSRSASALRRARKAARKAQLKRDKLKRKHEAAKRRSEDAKRKLREAEGEHEKLRLANEEAAAGGAEGKLAGKLATSEVKLAAAEKKAKDLARLTELSKTKMGGFRKLLGARKFGEGLLAGYFAVPALKAFAVYAAAPNGQDPEITSKMAQKVFYESAFPADARAEFDKGNTAKGIELTVKDFAKNLIDGIKDMATFVADGGIQKILDEWKWFVKFQKEHPEDAQVVAQMLVKGAIGDIPTSMDAAGNLVYGAVTGDQAAKQKAASEAFALAKKAHNNDPDAIAKLAAIAGQVTDASPPSLGRKKPDEASDGPKRPPPGRPVASANSASAKNDG